MFAAQLSLRRSLAGSASLAGARRGLASVVKPPPGGGTFTQSVSPAPVPSTLHLKSGHSFVGQSFGAPRTQFGEVVFTTSITSYTESLTDPSYQGQILTFTQPLMGNYGVPDNFCGRSPVGHPADVDVGAFLESRGIQAAGVIVSNLCDRFSHFEAKESLAAWCARHNVPGISGIDTRALTTLLRNQGSTLGGIVVGEGHEATPDASNYFDPMAMNLISRVSTTEPYTVHPKGGESQARAHIALLDFGAKANITRSLLRQGVSVTVLPWNYDFNAVRDNFDGLFLSNGPGSPHSIPEAIETTRVAINEWDRPIFGICMGNQIIGLAAGIKAYRMKFGNRGHNQPVISLSTIRGGASTRAGRVYVTSQNHGYALAPPTGLGTFEEGTGFIEECDWPAGWQPLFVNANDGSIEGIQMIANNKRRSSVAAVQFHPEHAGGPDDASGMFADYIDEVVEQMAAQGRKPAAGLPSVGEMPNTPMGAFGAPTEVAAAA